MKKDLSTRLQRAALAMVVLLLGAVIATPALEAQQAGGRFRVLVPKRLEPQQNADKDFGEDVAKELKELIDDMATHQPVDKDDLKNALKKYDLKEDDLDCIKSRQLAIQMNVELVMCGSYTPQGQVAASFISSQTGEGFEVPGFSAQEPKQAAQQIFGAFESYVGQLRLAAFCHDYLGSQQYASALENCRKALDMNPQSISALTGAARAYMEMDSLAQSLAVYRRVLEQNPAHQDALLSAGIVATRLNEQEAAREFFHQYLELNPGNVDVRLKVATDLANAGDPVGALAIAQEGIASASDNLTLVEYTGHFAMQAAEKARQGGANGEQGDMAAATGYYQTALDAYRQVFEAKGDSADVKMLGNMINVLSVLERHQEAADLGRQIVAVKTDDAGLWYNYARALSAAGQLDQALEAAARVIQLDADYPNVYSVQAQWLIQAGQLDRAKQVITQALERIQDPQQRTARADELARVVFAQGYNEKYKKGQSGEALQYFAVARDLAGTDQTRAMANFWTGFAHYERGRAIQEPNTAASAREALPIFQEAKRYLQQGQAYAATQPSIDLAKILDAVNQFIEIQELLIKRGR